MGVKIEGLSDVMRMYNDAPAEMLKDARSASREAGREVAKELRALMPQKWRRLVGSSVKNLSDGTLSTWIGLYRNKGSETWYKAYWKNYGTLKRRDPSHQFTRPVRSGVKRRNNEGQKAENFYDGPASMVGDRFLEAFVRKLQDKGYDIK
ncbi:MAG: hypothetical protein IJ363_14065 [Clostridia bacterium]|nr:hypothetical protein [Clostridia bacterium]